MLAVGAAAFAGASGIGRYRMEAIVDNPCIKSALGKSALETWLPAAAAVFLIASIGAFVVVLGAGARRQTTDATTRHAWIGLAVSIVLLLPVANLVAGDPLGFDAQMLPNCATMAFLGEMHESLARASRHRPGQRKLDRCIRRFMVARGVSRHSGLPG